MDLSLNSRPIFLTILSTKKVIPFHANQPGNLIATPGLPSCKHNLSYSQDADFTQIESQ